MKAQNNGIRHNSLIDQKNDELSVQKSSITRRIAITPDNAAQARALVQRWPALDSLVRSLQAADMFPGLRCLTVTLTGPEEWVGKGLAAVQPQNAPQAD